VCLALISSLAENVKRKVQTEQAASHTNWLDK